VYWGGYNSRLSPSPAKFLPGSRGPDRSGFASQKYCKRSRGDTVSFAPRIPIIRPASFCAVLRFSPSYSCRIHHRIQRFYRLFGLRWLQKLTSLMPPTRDNIFIRCWTRVARVALLLQSATLFGLQGTVLKVGSPRNIVRRAFSASDEGGGLNPRRCLGLVCEGRRWRPARVATQRGGADRESFREAIGEENGSAPERRFVKCVDLTRDPIDTETKGLNVKYLDVTLSGLTEPRDETSDETSQPLRSKTLFPALLSPCESGGAGDGIPGR
jgi:hypothetical protein